MKLFLPLAACYVGLVILANWLASAYTVDVPLTPYVAPAGVFCIGAVLVLRDWIQQLRGLYWTMPLVYAAGLISWGVGDLAGWTALEKIAIASVIAFSVSETIEAAEGRRDACGGELSKPPRRTGRVVDAHHLIGEVQQEVASVLVGEQAGQSR